jgi:hypothetical protein
MTEPYGDRQQSDGALLRRADSSPNALSFLSRFGLSRLSGFDLATVVLIAALFVLVLLTFRVYAVTNDEWVQHHYGELILNYYKSGFTDRALFQFDNLYLYGGLFDMVAVALSHVVPLEVYDLRHLMTGLCGIGGIVAAAAIARRIAGPRAGFLAALLLATCGAWYGTMFNHTKDIPLAAMMTTASYFLIRTARDLPRPRWRDVIGLGLFTGFALGIKVLGLLLIGYTGVLVLASIPRPVTKREAFGFIGTCVLRFLPALLIAYPIMLAAWPWSALSPLNPVRGLFQFAEFHYHIETWLDGQLYEMATAPRLYVPIYLAIRLPLLLLGAAALSLVLVMLPRAMSRLFPETKRRETAMVIFMVLFPLACQVIGHGPAFTGMRHFLFVVPLLAVLAAIALNAVITSLGRKHLALATAAFALVLADAGWNTRLLVELHPYEYLYYNQIVGGLHGAARRYVMDYWVEIMPALVAQLASFLKRTEAHKKPVLPVYNVDVCGDRHAFERELKVQHLTNRLRWTDDWDHADFFIAPTHGNCDELLKGRTIATIEREGTLIGVVKDRRRITRPALVEAE